MTHYIKRIIPQQVHAFFDKTRNWSACVRQCTIHIMENGLNLTDEEYLEASQLPILFRELISQIVNLKPENPKEYAKKYFQR